MQIIANQTLQNAQQMNHNRNHAGKGVISVNNYTVGRLSM